MSTKTLREIQTGAMWGAHTYSREFNADPRPHHDAAHAVLHITKATGKVAGLLDDLDHAQDFVAAITGTCHRDDVARYLADVVICALRAANTWPGGAIDMTNAIEARLRGKGIGPQP